MRLYFLRHAHAFAREDWQGEEPARPLTDKGRKQAEAAAAGLATLRPAIGAIISSPYARAYETAVIVGRVLSMPVESADDLTPGFDLSRLDHTLTLRPEVDGPLFVGHEPDRWRRRRAASSSRPMTCRAAQARWSLPDAVRWPGCAHGASCKRWPRAAE